MNTSIKIEKTTSLINKLLDFIVKTNSDELSVVVNNDFQRKTSFINYYLDDDITSDINGIATESTISIIKYGEKKKVTRYNDDFTSNNRNTSMFEIEIPNEKLRSGLRIIDVPSSLFHLMREFYNNSNIHCNKLMWCSF